MQTYSRTIRQSWYDSQLQLSGTFVATPTNAADDPPEAGWTWELKITNSRGAVPLYNTLYEVMGGPVASPTLAEEEAAAIWRQHRTVIAAQRDAMESEENPSQYAVLLLRGGKYYSIALDGVPRACDEALTRWRTHDPATRWPYLIESGDLYDAGAACTEVLRRLLSAPGKDR